MAHMFTIKKETSDYNALRTSEDTENEIEAHGEIKTGRRPGTWSTIQVLGLVLVTFISSGILGFELGSHRAPPRARELLEPSGDVSYPMIYNKTYTLPPSPESNAAWDAMFPKGVGFVQHPTISPTSSGIAVFHELHCVNILRVGYYAALNGTLEEMQHVHDHNKRPDPHHLRHCFDYLRQSLMCAADTNLEPVDLELGGVTGWRFERKCRDFEGVKAWAEENRHWPTLPKKEEKEDEKGMGREMDMDSS